MRTVNATLLAALQAGNPTPYLKAYVGYANGTIKHSYTSLWAYRLTGTTLEMWIPSVADFGSDQTHVWLERGLSIAGTTYTITTSRFFIWEQEYLPNQVTHFKGGLVPHEYYSAPGDDTYANVIDAFFAEYDKTTTYKDDTEDWLDYQFLPTGQNILMNAAVRFLNLLQQKRLISVCDNGGEDVRIFSKDVLGTAVATIAIADEFLIRTTTLRSRQYIWRDEAGTMYQDGDLTDPIHNLGYMASTYDPPARNNGTYELAAYIRPDLRIQDGDTITVSFYGGAKSTTCFAKVTEEWDAKAGKLPRWRLKLESYPVFDNTEGGALPSTIERVSNYTPLNTGTFDGVLSDSDNNVQAAFETLDEAGKINWQTVTTFYNSWVSFGGGAAAKYGLDGLGRLHFRGVIASGTIGLKAFTLPAGYLPTVQMTILTICSAGVTYYDIATNGDVIPWVNAPAWLVLMSSIPLS